jgi:hypothetical protein
MADAGEPGTGGTAGGGTSGAGGSAGSGGAGTGGAGTGGGGTGGGGTGGTAGSGGAGTGGTAGSGGGGLDDCATGCVRLAMDAFETVDEKAHYVISFSAATDLTGRTIAYKVYKEAGGNGEFRGYIQQGGPNFQFSVIGGVALSTLTAGWQTVTLSVANEMGDANPASILRIGIEVIGVGGAPWAPAVIYVDSVTVTAAVTGSPWNFDMASSVAAPGNTDRANQIWLNNGASDTTVSGAALDWFTP